MLDVLQIILHHIAFFPLIFHKVSNFQHPSVIGFDVINACIIVLMVYGTYHLDDFRCFLILTQTCCCPLIDAWYMYDRLLSCVEHFSYMIQIRAMIEVITQNKIFEVFVAIQLLVIVIGNGIELGFVLCSEYRDAVTSEVTACHCHDMSC